MLYEKFKKAWEENDAEAEFDLYHQDWEFKFHSNGRIMEGAIRVYCSTQHSSF